MKRMGSGAAVGVVCVVLALAGCGSSPAKTTAAPAAPTASTPSTRVAGIPKPTGTDVDPAVCKATKAALVADQQKSSKDGSDQKKVGADLKAAAASVRAEAAATKNAELKTTLAAMAVGYDNLAADILSGTFAATAAGQVQTAGAELDRLCPQESV